MTKTEQIEFSNIVIPSSIRDVKEGLATRIEALNYVSGYLLAAVILGHMTDRERRQITTDFKSKLDEIKKSREDKE